MSIGIGVLVFNPLDDENHLERITTCIKSLINAASISNKKTNLFILLNESFVESINKNGVGDKTKNAITAIAKQYDFVEILSIKYKDSMNVKGYNFLLKHIHQHKNNFKFVSVFADDYVVPNNWIDIVFDEFLVHPKADFIMPSTSYVTHKNLLVPFDDLKHWDLDIRNGVRVGVKKNATIEDINKISLSLSNFRTIKYTPSASFETTIFDRNCLDKIGYLHEQYFSVFWNTEYFKRMIKSGVLGYISRKCFVFHYGKGGTTSLYKKTGDEKFSGSPVEKNLISDVDLYNKRNNKNIGYWWKTLKPSQKTLSKKTISELVEYYDRRDKSIFITLKSVIKKIL